MSESSLKHIVVTIVVSPTGEGENARLDAQHSVSVNGRPVAGTQLALILTGPIALSVDAGIESTDHMRAIAQAAGALSHGMQDAALGATLAELNRLQRTVEAASKVVETA